MAKKTTTLKKKAVSTAATAPKRAARKRAPVKAVARTAATPVAARTIDRDAFDAEVRRAAYELAAARKFRGGSAFEDWVRAEKEVRARLATEGVSPPQQRGSAHS